MMLGGGLFLLALFFRSVDMWLCPVIPGGTHFLWHLTNCLVFWFVINTFAIHDSANAR